ncbi:hypothetical protein [Phycicoccus sp. 3266]|uniref:hypothetical protein n=1 Tax=Phycicoccus sp. 3266 TaxID=2817751 RepID=UPI002866448B|nr:hypothetical protein [Phycicoccus sp. 3266]MDR6862731.1 hypothetical protein [Phycicoccus sp. 3266]
MARTTDNEGLSIGYRILWRIRYLGWHLYGPAELQGPSDPHERLRRERRRKVEAARAARPAKG